jgi:hypothetical protein
VGCGVLLINVGVNQFSIGREDFDGVGVFVTVGVLVLVGVAVGVTVLVLLFVGVLLLEIVGVIV